MPENPDRIAIAVMGCAGRMGQMLVRAVDERADCTLIGATVEPGHEWAGRDLGEAMGGQARGLLVTDDPLPVFAAAHAVLDFTSPSASVEHADLSAQARLVHVIGTTGFADDDYAR
ncbi:MAG TPA: 4-hydroxy-tetrahydrodipicolinate reductase, partial [Paracoccaceae bacterium]|nr:4-hydroxy-tetrahydrodipicolinate reductase [Paracoccaceae bacterium]